MSDLKINGPFRIDAHPDVEIWEASSESERSYSCVALCRRSWTYDWPALGGTRWIHVDHGSFDAARGVALKEAARLAEAMRNKNKLLQRAEDELRATDSRWEGRSPSFGWQGGKGVTLTTKSGDWLTPTRLMNHGFLVERLNGAYYASEDQGVGKGELRWIARATRFNVGLGCGMDTGDATAVGVLSAIYEGALREGLIADGSIQREEMLAPDCPPVFEGLTIIVIGAGKVGLPLIGHLVQRRARCFVFDPQLNRQGVKNFFQGTRDRGAAVDSTHAAILAELERDGRLIRSEREALSLKEAHILSPNGGATDWLRREIEAGCSAAEYLAQQKASRHGKLTLIAGAGNAQLVDDPAVKGDAECLLRPLSREGIQWIPDPIVSPGGVIAVSHEQKDSWVASNVRSDSYDIVKQNVAKLYDGASKTGRGGALGLYEAFQVRLQSEAIASASAERAGGEPSLHGL